MNQQRSDTPTVMSGALCRNDSVPSQMARLDMPQLPDRRDVMTDSRFSIVLAAGAAALIWSVGAGAQAPPSSRTITEADCTAAKLGDSIPITTIGEPVSAVTLSAPRWNAAAKGLPPYCTVNGAMTPVDRAPNAKPINFQVAFPYAWNGRAAQLGGGGMNGT